MKLFIIADADQMEALGQRFAVAVRGKGGVFHLRGELGAGKTTFVRGFCRGMGHAGFVKSPTFTLVESYTVAGREVHHFDLYRIADPQELEFMGFRDYLTPGSVCLVEWPERGAGLLPEADVILAFADVPGGRRVEMEARTPAGERIVERV
jgi:tRNA threonylcarbamoyladenosine biosynthesis protein TsaE